MFRAIATATVVGVALILSAPVYAASAAPEESQAPVAEHVQKPAAPETEAVQARSGEKAQPTLYRVGARADGHFLFAFPGTGPPQVLPMLPPSLIAGSGFGF